MFACSAETEADEVGIQPSARSGCWQSTSRALVYGKHKASWFKGTDVLASLTRVMSPALAKTYNAYYQKQWNSYKAAKNKMAK